MRRAFGAPPKKWKYHNYVFTKNLLGGVSESRGGRAGLGRGAGGRTPPHNEMLGKNTKNPKIGPTGLNRPGATKGDPKRVQKVSFFLLRATFDGPNFSVGPPSAAKKINR